MSVVWEYRGRLHRWDVDWTSLNDDDIQWIQCTSSAFNGTTWSAWGWKIATSEQTKTCLVMRVDAKMTIDQLIQRGYMHHYQTESNRVCGHIVVDLKRHLVRHLSQLMSQLRQKKNGWIWTPSEYCPSNGKPRGKKRIF